MQKKVLKNTFRILAVVIGLYPLLYLVLDRTFGLLQTKTDATLSNFYWNIGFYGHIFLGGVALLIGWIQFNAKFRTTRIQLHRQIGKTYVIAAISSSIFGLFIAYFATGGIISVVGFGLLAIIWFYTTTKAFLEIKKGNVSTHEHYMTYSYAACFAAVTLRLWLPILTFALNDFFIAYKIVAWLCWVPNLFIAHLLVAKQKKKNMFSDKHLQEAFALHANVMEVKEGDVIMLPGQYIKIIPIVEKGCIRVLRQNKQGEETFLYHIMPGETCALSLTCCSMQKPSEIKAIAEEDTTLWAIPIQQLEIWQQFKEWREFVALTYQTRFDRLLKTVDAIAFEKMDEQLWRYLLARANAKESDTLYISHEEIANELNMQREAATRLIKKLKDLGYLETGRNEIRLLRKE